MSPRRSPKKSRVYIARSKAAGPCGHEHDSIAAASRCACKFNKCIHHELTKVRDVRPCSVCQPVVTRHGR